MLALQQIGKNARAASQQMARASTQQKNQVILNLAEIIWQNREEILRANQEDLTNAFQDGLAPAMLDRLKLDEERLQSCASDLRSVAALADPVGEVFEEQTMPNGLRVHKQRVPLGVLGIIYESRPNVTLDAASLAIKSGNCVILRGGKESIRSNQALVQTIKQALASVDLPADTVQFIDSPDRGLVLELLKMRSFVDMIIPRGSASLHQFCLENSTIPVITGGMGICHLFVDASADQVAAIQVIRNAKIQRPTVCNALDTTLVHQTIAKEFIPRLLQTLTADGVEFRLDERAWQCVVSKTGLKVSPAGEDDFDTEWMSLILGIKVVNDLDEAIAHIRAHSTGHSDGILTSNEQNAARFVSGIDSAAVYVNASTRFTDGAQLGLGAEVAISTQRLHARGPMGLRELTTYKWIIRGNYHIRK
jgi:glutamate-5-semialdehyde dehydrogenase